MDLNLLYNHALMLERHQPRRNINVGRQANKTNAVRPDILK